MRPATADDILSGWSLWSKDIIFLITADSKAGPQAWVDAYHDAHSSPSVASLPLKSGALQGAIVVDNPLNQRFESLHITYDGINGQLPNLDLFNTAVSIASGQMGIPVSLQRMWKHGDTYKERLQTMLRGMTSQGLGHASGPHSSFIPYHVDAITIKAIGLGWHDEMAMGRVVESLFRSLNNLLEHLHQSFFFYLLMQANRFVSIGTYLPSAMLVAVNFSIMAIALWTQSGRPPKAKIAIPELPPKKLESEVVVVKHREMTAIIPKQDLAILERHLFLPVLFVLSLHFLGGIPLYIFNNTTQSVSFIPCPLQLLLILHRTSPPPSSSSRSPTSSYPPSSPPSSLTTFTPHTPNASSSNASHSCSLACSSPLSPPLTFPSPSLSACSPVRSPSWAFPLQILQKRGPPRRGSRCGRWAQTLCCTRWRRQLCSQVYVGTWERRSRRYCCRRRLVGRSRGCGRRWWCGVFGGLRGSWGRCL